jgi:two-component system NarL family sensor kinase
MAVFRVIQESLTNVFRHAGSDSARVDIERQSDRVIVRVRDYGKGVSAEVAGGRYSPDRGVGIGGMRERVRQLNGELVIARAEPGTLVEARIPILGLSLDTLKTI